MSATRDDLKLTNMRYKEKLSKTEKSLVQKMKRILDLELAQANVPLSN